MYSAAQEREEDREWIPGMMPRAYCQTPMICIDGKPVLFDMCMRYAGMRETTQPHNMARTWEMVPEENTTLVITRDKHAYEFKGQFTAMVRPSGRRMLCFTTDRAVIHGRS